MSILYPWLSVFINQRTRSQINTDVYLREFAGKLLHVISRQQTDADERKMSSY